MKKALRVILPLAILGLIGVLGVIKGQQQQSGGAGSAVTATQAGTWNVNAIQSGTWTVNQGGTWNVGLSAGANLIGLVKMVPIHGCTGNTVQDIQQVDVGTGAGSNLTTIDTCVFWVHVNNKTASPVTVRVSDRAGTPFVYIGGSTDFSVPTGFSDIPFFGKKFTSGVNVIAGTASALNATLMGVSN